MPTHANTANIVSSKFKWPIFELSAEKQNNCTLCTTIMHISQILPEICHCSIVKEVFVDVLVTLPVVGRFLHRLAVWTRMVQMVIQLLLISHRSYKIKWNAKHAKAYQSSLLCTMHYVSTLRFAKVNLIKRFLIDWLIISMLQAYKI